MLSDKRIWLLLLLAVIVAALYLQIRQPDTVAVKLHRIGTGEVSETVANTRVGTVKACRRAYLAPATGGQVAVLKVREGDTVQQGQLLLEVWNRDLIAQVALQKAQIKVSRANADEACIAAAGARREAVRLARLQTKNRLVSEDLVDIAITKADAGDAACIAGKRTTEVNQARLESAHAAVERTRIYAPFDGVIAEINAELGEFVTPSPPGIPTLPPIDLLDVSCLYVSAPIDEVDAPAIKVGMSACVSLDAFTQPRCSGTVSRVAPYVLEKEKQARTVEVEVKLSLAGDLAGLLPGYSADIEVLLQNKTNVLRVPTEAVLEDNRVLKVNAHNRLEEHTFEPGLSNWRFVEIKSGLEQGDKVVLSVGQQGVEAGVLIREQP